MKNLFQLNKYILKYRTLLIVGTIFILISNIFALYPAEFVRHAFDNIQDKLQRAIDNLKFLNLGFSMAFFMTEYEEKVFYHRQIRKCKFI